MKVKSFDLFDTLIGRHHYSPHSIFELVEKQFPFPGFSFFRIAAELKSDHTLPGIYRELQKLLNVSKKQANALMQFEFETELNHIFPIHENLNQVKDGDLVVTDTYYDKSQIEQILKKIGLQKKVRIYATPLGKNSGSVWDIIRKKHKISSHLGDSLHSDVNMAQSRNIDSIHYSKSALSPIEKALMDIGQNQLGCLIRALRLQNPYAPDSPEYLLWNDQCQLNVPLLIQASIYLDAFCKEHKKKRILFTSRDGCLWIQVFQKLFPQYEAIYFHTSRHAYIFPTPSYVKYVRSVYTDDSIIADLDGSGRSCKLFFRKHFKILPTYLAIVNFGKKHHAIVRRKEVYEGIEKLNYDLVGSFFDIQEGKPVRSPPEYDLRFIHPSHNCIAKCIEMINSFKIPTFDLRIIDWAVDAMESEIAIDKYIDHAMFHVQIEGKDKQIKHLHYLRSGLLLDLSEKGSSSHTEPV